ncbi:hypothetical protein KUCAC02_029773 [Chaenocephalus aceratus]|nr:hypothetical protein KUCAC02_029773 [Chaenocephalus aceratus]
MDCTYIALYPVFKTPQSALHTTCRSPIHTEQCMLGHALTYIHIHTPLAMPSGATQG